MCEYVESMFESSLCIALSCMSLLVINWNSIFQMLMFVLVLIETRIKIYGSIFFASCSIWVPSQSIYIGYNSTWCEIVIEITFHHRNCFEEKDVVQMFWITRRIFHQQFNCKKNHRYSKPIFRSASSYVTRYIRCAHLSITYSNNSTANWTLW